MQKEIIKKLHDMGFNLMPVKNNSKIPMVNEWKSLQTKKYTGEFSEGCNAAIITGETSGNVFILDLDEFSIYDDFKEYHNKTFTVKSGKGYHLYFKTNGFLPPSAEGISDKRGRSIDIKSQGNCLTAPGSFVIPDKDKLHLYSPEKRNGFTYDIICDLPPLMIDPLTIKTKLDAMGFVGARKSINDIKNGVGHGSRDNDTFKYACYCVRTFGLSGKPLEKAVFDLNNMNTPPLPKEDVLRIIGRAIGYEGGNIEPIDNIVKKEIERDKNIELKMQNINPTYEGVPIIFHATITAMGERQTITREINYTCSDGHITNIKCERFEDIRVPVVCTHLSCKSRHFEVDRDTLVTEYIQLIRIEEFLEESKESSPIEFDAEIMGDDIGTAFVGQNKIFTAKFRSIKQKNLKNNNIVFEIISMENMEQLKGCMPEPEEIDRWKKTDIFNKCIDSVAPQLLYNPLIKKSIMLSIAGGIELNGNRGESHVILLGDAQLGKSEILEEFYKLTPGSGFAIGMNTTAVGLTAGMIKAYNGTSMLRPGLLPKHTGNPVYIDEGDKLSKAALESLFECMEQQTVTTNKGNAVGSRMPARNQIIFSGNPKNGKYDSNIPIMQNFDLPEPFVTRFDIIWLIVDSNDYANDEKVREHIRNFPSMKSQYMPPDEIQRYITYIRTLHATISKEFSIKLDEIHKKMRILNKKTDGMNIGWRQYYGLYRLVTACAACNLREEVTQDDINTVYEIIKESMKSLKMDLDEGVNDGVFITEKQSMEKIFLEICNRFSDKNGEIDKEDVIEEISKHKLFNPLRARVEWEKREPNMTLNNVTHLYKL